MTLILASASPRRYQILSLLHLPFLMVPPDISEVMSERRSPDQEVIHLARRKAASLAPRFPGGVLIGSDTLIHLDSGKIGKPKDRDDAREILRRLRGRTHEVITGVVILNEADGRSFDRVERVRVTMRASTDTEIETYVATGDPLDKAGAYSLQGAGRGLLAGLEGDYLAAVGLPLRAVAEGVRAMGLPVACDLDRLYRERDFLNWKTFD